MTFPMERRRRLEEGYTYLSDKEARFPIKLEAQSVRTGSSLWHKACGHGGV